MSYAKLNKISFFLPENIVTNSDLSVEFPDWSEQKIESKTGIMKRHVAKAGEFASDLAVLAAEKLFSEGVDRGTIDFLIYCTQCPDYFLPSTSCLIQKRLKLNINCGAFDINLGCSGFLYGLAIAQGLISTGQASNILFITSDTYNQYIKKSDLKLRVIFGDGAAATLIEGTTVSTALWKFKFGTDGDGASQLIVNSGGSRNSGANSGSPHLFMNGPEIFSFTLRTIPKLVNDLLFELKLTLSDVDLFIFHQANKFMLEHLRDALKIPPAKFIINMSECGNTVSSSIPIALAIAQKDGLIHTGSKIMLVGFGVGYSWGATIITWHR